MQAPYTYTFSASLHITQAMHRIFHFPTSFEGNIHHESASLSGSGGASKPSWEAHKLLGMDFTKDRYQVGQVYVPAAFYYISTAHKSHWAAPESDHMDQWCW